MCSVLQQHSPPTTARRSAPRVQYHRGAFYISPITVVCIVVGGGPVIWSVEGSTGSTGRDGAVASTVWPVKYPSVPREVE